MIYLDNSATTRPNEACVAAMNELLTECWFNPSSVYRPGMDAAHRLKTARAQVAQALGAETERVFFTSGGTEADNWAIFSTAKRLGKRGRHIVTTAVEHHAVLHPMQQLEAQGFEVTYLQPDETGFVSVEALKAALRPDTILVSIMMVNNESGAVMPIADMVRATRRLAPLALFHTDAVQGFLKVPFTPAGLGVDLLSLSGHKIHAPKGIGALYIRQGLPLKPFILGGGQENGLRSGTEPTGQIAAFAVACQTGKEKMAQSLAHMNQLKAYTLERLHAEVPQVEEIISGDAPHILALTLPGYKSEVLVRVMGDKGVCISAGSACHRGKASHVYEVMGLTKPQRDGAFRVSFSDWSTKEDVDCFVQALKETQEMLFPTMS